MQISDQKVGIKKICYIPIHSLVAILTNSYNLTPDLGTELIVIDKYNICSIEGERGLMG